MSTYAEPVRSIQDVVSAYITSNRTTPYVSMTSALRAIRTYMPDCPLCDKELETLVAAVAIDAGLPVSFDSASKEQANP